MVKRGRKTGYAIGIRKKKELLFTDLCTMYFKKYEATILNEALKYNKGYAPIYYTLGSTYYAVSFFKVGAFNNEKNTK